jgi:hypothetical protein
MGECALKTRPGTLHYNVSWPNVNGIHAATISSDTITTEMAHSSFHEVGVVAQVGNRTISAAQPGEALRIWSGKESKALSDSHKFLSIGPPRLMVTTNLVPQVPESFPANSGWPPPVSPWSPFVRSRLRHRRSSSLDGICVFNTISAHFLVVHVLVVCSKGLSPRDE